MSVRDFGKLIMIYDSLNGNLLFSMDYLDYCTPEGCSFFLSKIEKFLDEDMEIYTKYGYKS